MNTLRRTSLVFGLFFAGTFIFSIPALFFYNPVLHDSNYILGGGFDRSASMGALFEILTAICNIATAIVIFPVVKRVSESAALGYIASRTVESVMILSGQGLFAFHDWTFLLGPQFGSGCGNGILLGYLMYRSGLIPRRMALLGLIGGPLAFAGGVLVLFDVVKPLSAGLFALTAIEIAWELSITIYAIFIGFRPTQEK